MILYKILQLHIHAPSEHTFDGEERDLELHIVHKSYNDDSLAVVAIYFDLDEGGDRTNPFLDALKLDQHNPTNLTIPL